MLIKKDGLLITHSDSKGILPWIYKFFNIIAKNPNENWVPFGIESKDMFFLCEREEDWELVQRATNTSGEDYFSSSELILKASSEQEYVTFTPAPNEVSINDYLESNDLS